MQSLCLQHALDEKRCMAWLYTALNLLMFARSAAAEPALQTHVFTSVIAGEILSQVILSLFDRKRSLRVRDLERF